MLFTKLATTLLFVGWFFAQSQPSPSPSPTVSPEEFELFQKAFQSFTTTINITLGIFSAILAALGGIGIFVFGRSLQETKKSVDRLVETEVNKTISGAIEKRIGYLEKVLDREEVTGKTRVNYLLLTTAHPSPPIAFRLLRNRGFQQIDFHNEVPSSLENSVVVLDWANYDFSEEQQRQQVNEIINRAATSSILIVYIKKRSSVVNELLERNEIDFKIAANNSLSLMGYVIDAAHISAAMQRGNI